MSAYGILARPTAPSAPVGAQLFQLKAQNGAYNAIAFIHLDGSSVPPHWVGYLHSIFVRELEDGRSYPQRGPMSDIEFRNYFLAYDVVIGIFVNSTETNAEYPRQGTPFDLKSLGPLESAEPSERIGCFYYIKPNYPGRSSHLCNAGFVVPPNSRGRGIGSLAGRSFLHVAPRLGYRGSVFNLVYATNEASMRIWDKLGFQRVGRIPSAGLLKTGSGEDEHYVDAHVIYGDFAKIAPPFV